MSKRTPLSERYPVGTQIRVEIQKPNKGHYPIARNDEGVICLLKKGIKGFYEYNSIWLAEVVEAHEKKLIIVPKEVLMSAAAHSFEAHKKAQEAFGKVKSQKVKVTKGFQYKTGVELDKEEKA